eukprot:TRINITY_DN1015_c0_g2_i1.p1 TRINITY_DN1015_c0_g2~~TRINITY_DN1015_c0_g2_i1.p1  ORF type:complete len:735 (-),score=150.99 TRINITY_DN1015_c0_g2_i1:306-2408(-)
MAANHDEHPSALEAFHGCGYCQEVFAQSSQLEVHIKMIHPGSSFKSIPAAAPAAKAQAGAISKSMPLSEVARHCTPEDCWVALNGKVYDLTEFMDRHPGGPTTILAWAGKDASKFFNDIHKGIKIEQYLRPESFLGDLGVDENLMTESFWHTLREARIEEVREELDKLLDGGLGLPGRAGSISSLLQEGRLDEDLKAKLQHLETQKRVALDAEDYSKALTIKKTAESLIDNKQIVAATGSNGGIPLSEVAHHNKPHDCWIALNGSVYDLTDFLMHHPEQRNSILAWAGRDATSMWNKIPGRFPSSTWSDYFMRPEAKMGDVIEEPSEDPTSEQVLQLQAELRRLEGPSEADILAYRAAAAKVPAAVQGAKLSEDARFPRLQEVSSGKELPFFTRAEVAKHKGPADGPPGTEPFIIVHNRVYDLRPLLGNHPGGDDILLARAGTDVTDEFEVFEHSEKARLQRDRDMLVGEIVPAECKDWAAEASAAEKSGQQTSELARYLRYKAGDALVACVAWYVYKTFNHRKPLSQFTYSRGLRHLHFLMAIGIFGAIGSAHAASRSEGQAKRRFLQLHKQTGWAMLLALIVRACFRIRSGIPPRFPGNRMLQFVETQSLRAFYLLLLALPLSGVANEYYLKWAPGSEMTGSENDDKRNDQLAKQAIVVHKSLGKFLEFVWLPFHLGYTTLYHYSKGRGVVRKVSPFI